MKRPELSLSIFALMHISIIAGGIPIMLMGSPLPLLCILILLKVGMDIFLHVKEHCSEGVSVI